MRSAVFSTTTVGVLCCALGVVAAEAGWQTPGAQPESEQTVRTIVGCLVQGLPPAASSEQRADTAADAKDFFVRTPTVAVPVGTSVAVGTPGTTSTATSAGKPADDSFYRITGLGAAQLTPHVGHRVEVQGHLAPSGPEGSATTARTTVDQSGRATTTAQTRVIVAGVLHATTVKMVSPKCE